MAIEPLLLSTTSIVTRLEGASLTNATGFFFRTGRKLFLVTSRHVFRDEETEHRPDEIEIEIHTDAANATQAVGFSIPLYRDGRAQWVSGEDSGGEVDIALIEIDQRALPAGAVYAGFTPRHLVARGETVALGSPMLVVGFPLGFHDTFHHLPVARHAINASSFSLRFQGRGYFLTDARTHRGSSGAPVVARSDDARLGELPWKLLGVHSARLDMSTRDSGVDEALGLNCAWFADILPSLTTRRCTAG
ncbi:MAG: S1 family peptidase [Gammaproteobacteria bacterium]